MIRKNIILLVVTSIVILLPILAGLILWDTLPEQVATHFGTDGEPDGWSGRVFTVFGMPLILLAVHWLCILVTAADPRQNSVAGKIIHIILWLIPAMSLLMSAVVYTHAMGIDFDNELIMTLFIGLLFVVIGNYLPKCRQSYTVGIRLPWTLADEDNWNRTHRLAGWVWITAGIIILATAFLRNFIILTVVLLIAAAVPTVYSYLLWHRASRR